MKIDLERIYKKQKKELGESATDPLIHQEFLAELVQIGEDFIQSKIVKNFKKNEYHCNICNDRYDNQLDANNCCRS